MDNRPIKRRRITHNWYWKCPKCGFGPISSDFTVCKSPVWPQMNLGGCIGLRPNPSFLQ